MKTLITARFDRNYTDLLETITTDYEFAGYGVTGEKMPVPQMKEKIKGVELLREHGYEQERGLCQCGH